MPGGQIPAQVGIGLPVFLCANQTGYALDVYKALVIADQIFPRLKAAQMLFDHLLIDIEMIILFEETAFCIFAPDVCQGVTDPLSLQSIFLFQLAKNCPE